MMLEAKWKIILLGFAFAATAVVSYNRGEASSDRIHEAAMAQHLLEDQTNARIASDLQRQREHAFNVFREEQESTHVARMSAVQSQLDDLSRSNDGLRSQLSKVDAKLRRASDDARAAGVHEGTINTALVLSKLFSEATEELRRVAGTADEWHLKATECAAFYDGIRSR